MKAERIHFVDGLIHGPVLLGDSVSSDHDAGAVLTILAMDEHPLTGCLMEQLQKLGDLSIRRRQPAPDRNVEIADTQRFSNLALPLDLLPLFSQIDNRRDAQLLEFCEALGGGLCTAGKRIADLSRVWDTCEF
jgi:hypothetical protein